MCNANTSFPYVNDMAISNDTLVIAGDFLDMGGIEVRQGSHARFLRIMGPLFRRRCSNNNPCGYKLLCPFCQCYRIAFQVTINCFFGRQFMVLKFSARQACRLDLKLNFCFVFVLWWFVFCIFLFGLFFFFCLIDCCGCCYLHMCSGRRRLPTSWQPHMRMRGQATYWALFSKAHLRVWSWCPSKCFLNMLRICQRCGHRELELAPRARHCDTSDNRA